MSALRDIIEAARADTGESLSGLTALSPQNDPYRLDTPAGGPPTVCGREIQGGVSGR